MIANKEESAARVKQFREWAAEQPPTTQQLINSWTLKISKDIRNIGDSAAHELLAQVFLAVYEDMKRSK